MCKSCCFSKNKFLRYGPKAKLFLYPLRFLTSCLKIISTSVITPTEFKTSRSLETAWIVHHCMQFPHLKRVKTALICTHHFSYIYSFCNRHGNAPTVFHIPNNSFLEASGISTHRFSMLTYNASNTSGNSFLICIHFVIQSVENRWKCAPAAS